MAQDKDGKTEKPTPKRLSDARKKGQVAKSQDLSSAISFVTFALALAGLSTYIFERTYVLMKNMLGSGLSLHTAIENDLSHIGLQAIIWVIVLGGPFFIIAILTGTIGNLIQVGFLFTAEPLKPSLNKINPINGFKNIFGKKAVFGLGKNLFKLFLVVGFTTYTIFQSAGMIMNATRVGSASLFPLVIDVISSLGFRLALFMGALGVADYVFQRYSHNKEMMMSIQEIKDEHKQMEGDPLVKSQRKARYRELLSGKISDVDEATVLINNPTHISIAIRYERGEDDVPIVVAKGADLMAMRMRERAQENNVPMFENKALARSLYKNSEVGDPIPNDMYQGVAEILALVFQMEERRKQKI
jgi:flagellar biosynthetic protein FlhB